MNMLCVCYVLQAVTAAGVKLLSWEQLLQLGADNPCDAVPPSPDDLSTIMYTSGTTGEQQDCCCNGIAAGVQKRNSIGSECGRWTHG
jgi:acyl-CoA synthetase (AMP-forming)/AMP-acid ligase II